MSLMGLNQGDTGKPELTENQTNANSASQTFSHKYS